MSAAREAQPSEGPEGPTLREWHEADAPQLGGCCPCNEAEAMSAVREAPCAHGEVPL